MISAIECIYLCELNEEKKIYGLGLCLGCKTRRSILSMYET